MKENYLLQCVMERYQPDKKIALSFHWLGEGVW